MALTAGAAQAATLKASYLFNGNLSSSVAGASDLVLTDPTGNDLLAMADDVERVLADIDADHGDGDVWVRTWRAPSGAAPCQRATLTGAGARPDHPIKRDCKSEQVSIRMGLLIWTSMYGRTLTPISYLDPDALLP